MHWTRPAPEVAAPYIAPGPHPSFSYDALDPFCLPLWGPPPARSLAGGEASTELGRVPPARSEASTGGVHIRGPPRGAARTGKEEDTEVGLTYFGKRYLNPQLGRWVSADPLGVHAPGKADLNLYAYVSGAVLKSTDPVGLDFWEFAQGMAAQAADQVQAAVEAKVAEVQANYALATTDPVAYAGKMVRESAVRAASTVYAAPVAAYHLATSAAEAPADVLAVTQEYNDFNAGRRAVKPTVTAMEVGAAVYGAARAGPTPPRSATATAEGAGAEASAAAREAATVRSSPAACSGPGCVLKGPSETPGTTVGSGGGSVGARGAVPEPAPGAGPVTQPRAPVSAEATRLPQDAAVNPTAPKALPTNRSIGRPSHN